MNTLVVFSVLVASCFAGYDKRPHGGKIKNSIYQINGLEKKIKEEGIAISFFFTGYKYGTCPHYIDYGGVGQSCFSDYHCPGAQKCCNYRCQVPREAQRYGSCPNNPASPGTGQYCNTDRDCYYNQKCCTGIYGTVNTCKYVSYSGYNGANVFGSGQFGGNLNGLQVGPFGTGLGQSVVFDDDFSGVGYPALGGGVPALGGGVPVLGGGVPALGGGVPFLGGVSPVGGAPLFGGVPAVGGVPSFGPVVPRKKTY